MKLSRFVAPVAVVLAISALTACSGSSSPTTPAADPALRSYLLSIREFAKDGELANVPTIDQLLRDLKGVQDPPKSLYGISKVFIDATYSEAWADQAAARAEAAASVGSSTLIAPFCANAGLADWAEQPKYLQDACSTRDATVQTYIDASIAWSVAVGQQCGDVQLDPVTAIDSCVATFAKQ